MACYFTMPMPPEASMDPEIRLGEIGARLAEIDQQHHGRRFPDAIRDEWNALNAERADLVELAVRRQRLADLAAQPAATERVDHQAARRPASRALWAEPVHPVGFDPAQMRDRALRVVDYYQRELSPAAGDRVDGVLRNADLTGDTAAWIVATANPAYASAFAKMLADPMMGHNRFDREEIEAVRQVSQVQIRNAALQEDTGTGGAYAIPFTLDPTVILTGAGALNPIRDLATVETIGTREWKGVAATGITAGYVAELTPATDASPTLTEPVIRTAQGRAFVQASIELFQDWGRIREEMTRLLDDARATVDATEFITGNGTDRPTGLLAIGSTGSLSTSQRVLSAGTNTFAVGDPWLLKAQIPARFQPGSAFIANPNILDTVFRFVGGGSTEPALMPTRDGALMGRPKAEVSTLVAATTTGSKVMVGGDFKRAFRIVDRLGATAEIVPHVMTTTGLPSGARGIYYFWRTGSAVVAPNGLRYLEIK
jgi:HK97 family phage major capsid protein